MSEITISLRECINNNRCMRNKPSSMTGGGRLISLDIMRIALAFLIYLFHSHMHFNCDYYFFNDFVSLGAISMTGFFMLSGYCLHLSNFSKDLTKLPEIKIFYLNRFFTILPAYYFIALTYTIYGTAEGLVTVKENVLLFLFETLCLQSTITSLFSYSHNSGTWFISCIMIMYLVYPFLQELLKQMSNKAKMCLAFILCVILLWAPFVVIVLGFGFVSLYANPFFRLLEFTIGVIIAQINYSEESNKILNLLRTKESLLFILFFFFFAVTFSCRIGIPFDYMLFNWIAISCFIGIMIPLGYIEFKKLQNTKWLLYLSSISYAFFLCQIGPIWKYSGILCDLLGSRANILKIAVSFTYCFLGAILIHELIEKKSSKYLRAKLL